MCYLINRRLQLGLTLRFLILITLFALFMLFEAYMACWPVASEYVPDALMPFAFRRILIRLFYFSIPIGFVIAAIVVILTHRIAGPLYRIECALDALVRGEEIAPIHLRKKDELKGLSRRINALIPLLQGSQAPSTPPSEPLDPPSPKDP